MCGPHESYKQYFNILCIYIYKCFFEPFTKWDAPPSSVSDWGVNFRIEFHLFINLQYRHHVVMIHVMALVINNMIWWPIDFLGCNWNIWSNGVWFIIGFTRPGKLTVCYGKSPFLMGKSTISMAIFNSYVKLPEGTILTLFDGIGLFAFASDW